jgi:predicted methyltransferase
VKRAMDLESDVRCRSCDGTGLVVPAQLAGLQGKLANTLSRFPKPDIMGKGQWFFTPGTIIRTLAYLYLKGDIEGRQIVCLCCPTIGIGLELLRQQAELPKVGITILDVDADIVEFVSASYPDIRVQHYDFQNSCPEELRGNFDCFFFDPLYDEEHYLLGLSRCVELTGRAVPDKVGYVVIPPEEIAPVASKTFGRTVPIQLSVFRAINEMGFCVTDFKDNFLEYTTPPAEVGILQRRDPLLPRGERLGDWRGSELVRISSTVETKPSIEGHYRLKKRISDSRRLTTNSDFIPLQELEPPSSVCRLCVKCFSSQPEDQRRRGYQEYWRPTVQVRPMASWRDEGDQLFEVAPSCAAFENTETGDLVMLKGPAARALWEAMRDITTLTGAIGVDEVLKLSLPDFEKLDPKTVRQEVLDFVAKLRELGLVTLEVVDNP